MAPGLLASLPRIEALRVCVCWRVSLARQAVNEVAGVLTATRQHDAVLRNGIRGGIVVWLSLLSQRGQFWCSAS